MVYPYTLVYQFLIFSLLGYGLTAGSGIPAPIETACCLLLLTFDLLKNKYLPKRLMVPAEWALIVLISIYRPAFAAGFGLIVPDILRMERLKMPAAALIILPPLFLFHLQHLFLFLIYIGICFYLSALAYALELKERQFRQVTDKERRYIYQLEQTQRQLLRQAEEKIHLTELKERNRIARDLHDTVGHKIAGLYMQLQAADKVKEKNRDKADQLIEKTIGGLSDTLRLIRDTAHNMIPKSKHGVGDIESLLASFTYCETDFTYSGDMRRISKLHWQVITTNIQEALTNVFKHSHATKVRITLTVNQHFIRLYIKDNGRGSAVVQDQLGLNGMKERVEQMGGSLSVDGRSGFLIVCILPLSGKEGGIFAYSNR